MWQITRGNTSVRDIPVYDKNGALVENLADAEEIHFHVCKHKECSGLIQKDLNNGIEVDIPDPGYLRMTFKPSETKIPPRKYFMALQIKWSDDEIYECKIKVDGKVTDQMEIVQEYIGQDK